VIGVILMVAITVILAAVIGTFAFGLFDRDTNPAPSAVFESDYDGTAELTIVHESGSEFDSANVEFKPGGSFTVKTDWSGEVTSGDSVTLTGVDPDETVRVVWADPREDDQTQVLYEWSGPKA
jgi:FlaG/FlaF family flagellin (archaellin)